MPVSIVCANVCVLLKAAPGAHAHALERSVTVQAALICAVTGACAFTYVVVPFLTHARWAFVCAHVTWQLASGARRRFTVVVECSSLSCLGMNIQASTRSSISL